MNTIVVSYDFTALERAAALIASSPRCVFHVLYVGPKEVDLHELAAIVQPLLLGAHFHVHAHIGRHAAKELYELAEDVGAELIICGPRDAKVVRDAKCDVIVARPPQYKPVEHVDVVEVDHHAHAHSPHHYSYGDKRAPLRPSDWPIY
jgi:hypothetical protein